MLLSVWVIINEWMKNEEEEEEEFSFADNCDSGYPTNGLCNRKIAIKKMLN